MTRTAGIFHIALLTLAAGLSLLLILTNSASGKDIHVDSEGNGDFETISEALETAEEGDTIRVYEGNYRENPVVKKGVAIVGNGTDKTVITGVEDSFYPDFQPSMEVLGEGAEIRDLTIQGDGDEWTSGILCQADNVRFSGIIVENVNKGIIIKSSEGVSFSNSGFRDIRDPKDPIYIPLAVDMVLLDSRSCSIRNNDFTLNGLSLRGQSEGSWNTHDIQDNELENGKNILYLKNTTSPGELPEDPGQLILASCQDVTLDGLTANATNTPVQLGFSSDVVIKNIDVGFCSMGIYIFQSDDVTVENNSFTLPNTTAILVEESQDCLVQSNHFNYGFDAGLLLRDATNILVLENEFHDVSMSPMSLEGYCQGINLSSNLIEEGYVGITSWDHTLDLTIHQNTFSNCSRSLDLEGCQDTLILGNQFLNASYAIQLDRCENTQILESFFLGSRSAAVVLGYANDTTLRKCVIKDGKDGLDFWDPCTNVSLSRCDLFNNTGYGIRGESDEFLKSEQVFWGHHTGPYHSRDNPEGKGEPVTGDADFEPWLPLPFASKRPEVLILSPAPPTALNENTYFQALGLDNRVVVRYSWRSSLDGELCNGTGDNFSTTLSTGEHLISLMVENDRGYWSSVAKQELRVHQRPVIHHANVSLETMLTTDTLYFSGYAEDDGTIAAYRWESSIDGDLRFSPSANFSRFGLSQGIHRIYLWVQDNDGVWVQSSYIRVAVYRRPVAEIDESLPGKVMDDDVTVFRGGGTAGTKLTVFLWTSSRDGVLYNGPNSSFSCSNLTNGTHGITLQVQDANAFWSYKEASTLKVNGRPRLKATLEPGGILKTQSAIFDGEAFDDGTVEFYIWYSSLDGELHNDSSPRFEASGLRLGVHDIIFRVMDNNGTWAELVLPFLVRDFPQIDNPQTSPDDDINEGELLEFRVDILSGKPMTTFLWTSSLDGVIYTGSSRFFDYSGLSPGRHSISVKAQNDAGFWSNEMKISVKVIPRPQAEIISITPSPCMVTEAVTFKGKGNGERAITTYRWSSSLDGLLFKGSGEEFTLNTLSLGIHNITLQVEDDEGYWSEKARTALCVNEYEEPNQLPVVVVNYPWEGNRILGSYVMLGNAYDPDGNISKVVVFIDDSSWEVAIGTDNWKFNWDSTTVANGEHVIRVKAWDGEGYGEEVSVRVTVDNRKDEGGSDSDSPDFGLVALTLAACLLVLAAILVPIYLGRAPKKPGK